MDDTKRCRSCRWWGDGTGDEPLPDDVRLCALTVRHRESVSPMVRAVHRESLALALGGGADGPPAWMALYTQPDFGCVQWGESTR